MTNSSAGANCSVVHEVGVVIADEVVQPAQNLLLVCSVVR